VGYVGPVRIATWNVNSVRSRIDRVAAFLQRSEVDVLAIQETKCREDQFPSLPLHELGYEVAHFGFNQWNGVAIISRVGLDDVARSFPDQPMFGDPPILEPRAIAATCGGIRVWSLYVPNGRTVLDSHYTYKLAWLAALRRDATTWLAADPYAQIALTGDWNIAPTDEDVWDIGAFAGSTHVSEPERAAFDAIVAVGFADVVRPFTPGPGIYTYWDYTRLAFQKRRGMRIDFILGSPGLAARVTNAEIVKDERRPGKNGDPAPSDHAPVMVDLADDGQ